MAGTTYNLGEAANQLANLVQRAAEGEEIVIAKAGTPMAKLVGLSQSSKPRRPGGWEGKVTISDDFDAPLPDELLNAFGDGFAGAAE